MSYWRIFYLLNARVVEPVLTQYALDHYVVAVVVVWLATPAVQAVKVMIVGVLSVLIDDCLVQLTFCCVLRGISTGEGSIQQRTTFCRAIAAEVPLVKQFDDIVFEVALHATAKTKAKLRRLSG